MRISEKDWLSKNLMGQKPRSFKLLNNGSIIKKSTKINNYSNRFRANIKSLLSGDQNEQL